MMIKFLLPTIRAYFVSYAGLPRACWQRIEINFINTISAGLVFFLSLYFVNTLGFTISEAGINISAYGVGTAIGGVLGGKLSDSFSPNIVSIFSLLIKALIFLALSIIQDFYLFIVCLFLLGLGSYGFTTSNNLWILDNCKGSEEIKHKTVNIIYASSNLGIGLAAIIVSLLVNKGFKYVFILVGILLLVSVIYLILQNNKSVKHSTNDDVDGLEKDKPATENSKIVWLVLSCLFFTGLTIAQLNTAYPIYISNHFPALGLHGVSILFVINCLTIVLFQTPFVNLFKNVNKLLLVGLGAFFIGFGMFMLVFAVTFSIAIVACIIYTIGEMLFFATAQLVCYQKGVKKKRGHSLGMFQMVYALSTIAGPAVGGFIYQNVGGTIVWYLSGLIGLLCLLTNSYFKAEY